MQYRTIGKTGVKVSEIGFGCGNNAVLMVRAPYDEQVKVVRRALDAGITFFDTAFAYGLGKSEENLGRVLKELGANPVISTKIRLEADCVGDIKAATVRAVEDGLNRLGRERVDFVQLHTRVTVERGMGKRFSLTPSDVLGANGVANSVIAGFKVMRER
ncbi:MAG: aldo/keto reductase, partial [Candidatus Binatia bacterium]